MSSDSRWPEPEPPNSLDPLDPEPPGPEPLEPPDLSQCGDHLVRYWWGTDLVSVSSSGYSSTTLMMSRQTRPTHRIFFWSAMLVRALVSAHSLDFDADAGHRQIKVALHASLPVGGSYKIKVPQLLTARQRAQSECCEEHFTSCHVISEQPENIELLCCHLLDCVWMTRHQVFTWWPFHRKTRQKFRKKTLVNI